MCTMGALKHVDCRQTLLFKTLDFTPTSVSIREIPIDAGAKMRVMGISVPNQPGVNSGMNEAGLAVAMCYYGTETNANSHHDWRTEDRRGLYNLQTLQQASSTVEGVSMLAALLEAQGSQIGGIHFLVDTTGTLGIVEHVGGKVLSRVMEDSTSLLVSANRSNLGLHQKSLRLPEALTRDRELRQAHLRSALNRFAELKAMPTELVMNELAYHSGNENEIGSICIHHQDLFGARANLSGIMATVTAMIFDVNLLELHYSVGCPCKGVWKKARF